MQTNREAALEMIDVLRDFITKTGEDKYCQLDTPEPHDIMIQAGMGVGYFWGEMIKRLHEIAVKHKYNQPFYEDLLKVLHEGLCLLAHRHPELLKKPHICENETVNNALDYVQKEAERWGVTLPEPPLSFFETEFLALIEKYGACSFTRFIAGFPNCHEQDVRFYLNKLLDKGKIYTFRTESGVEVFSTPVMKEKE